MIFLWQKSGMTTTDCHVHPPWGLTTQTGTSLVLTFAESLFLSTHPQHPLHLESLLPPCLVFFVPIHAPSLTSSAALWPTSVTPQRLATFQLLWSEGERRYCLQLKEFSLKLRGFAQRTNGNTKIKLVNVEVKSHAAYSTPHYPDYLTPAQLFPVSCDHHDGLETGMMSLKQKPIKACSWKTRGCEWVTTKWISFNLKRDKQTSETFPTGVDV